MISKKLRRHTCLPYRVITTEILPYYQFQIKEKEIIQLFGYFKLDWSRKPFMIFSSIKMQDHHLELLNK